MKRRAQLEMFSLRRAAARPRKSGARRAKALVGAVAKAGRNGCLPHVARPAHRKEHPVHVSMRRVAMGPSFRSQRVCAAIREVIAGAKRNGVRVVHYSVQDNHLHLMVEGATSADLSKQMRTLFSRIAFAVNAVARRHGKLFRDRHHRHALTTPREVRNALVYILFNHRKHGAVLPPAYTARITSAASEATATGRGRTATLDPCTSAWWFHDWSPSDHPPREWLLAPEEAPTSPPRTWLARTGWRRAFGAHRDAPLRFSESPRSAS